MHIRPRQPRDLATLETLARSVHAVDGYPPYLPDDDVLGFLDSSEALASWVAVVGDRIVGQICLHSGSSGEVMKLAAEVLGVESIRIGVVARLLVDPDSRRSGVALALLDRARSESIERDLVPILDVVDRFAPAIALYERAGWIRLGTVSVTLPDGSTMNEHVYAGPTS